MTEIEGAGGRAFAVGAALGVPGDVDTLFAGLEARLDKHLGVPPEETTPERFD
ncbi:hypothetical protein [Actinomadura rugatobispora]|uniref:Uncharacterized protein n=1 Tax=Actinomadura rugatobispora TaxID=1994 RepID=A0ABW0ZYC4_9ACTN|nr:hypothetical protein GCM10010200_106480 [Actinomadura rugatobispora]